METLTRREREKRARESEIVAAAEKIFFEKGFHDASMDEIARASQFSKRTLYQYFLSKEDLYFSVAAKEFRTVSEYLKRGVKNGSAGIEKVRQLCEAYCAYCKDCPQSFALMNYCQFIKTTKEKSPRSGEIQELRMALLREFAAVIAEGKADGSIRSDLDAAGTVMSLFMMITGFLSRFAELGKSISSAEHDRFVLFTLDLIEHAVKSAP